MVPNSLHRNKPLKRANPRRKDRFSFLRPTSFSLNTSNYPKQASDKPLVSISRDNNRTFSPHFDKLDAAKGKKLQMTENLKRLKRRGETNIMLWNDLKESAWQGLCHLSKWHVTLFFITWLDPWRCSKTFTISLGCSKEAAELILETSLSSRTIRN